MPRLELPSWITRKNRVPLVLQYEVVECGAASLSMILRYYGLFLPLSELRDRCGVSRDGSNLFNIKQAAESYGMSCSGAEASVEDLIEERDCYPLIGWWDRNHFIVIESVSPTSVRIADPAKGRYKLSLEEFKKHFSGIILLLEPTDGLKPAGKAESEFNQFIGYLSDFRLSLGIIGIITLAQVPPRLIEAGLSGAFVSEFIQNRRFDYGIPIAWLTLFISILFICFSLLLAALNRRLTVKLSKRLTLMIAKKIFTVDFKFYSSRMTGDIAERLGLASTITSNLFHQLVPHLLGISTSILIAPFVLLISWQLSIVTIIYLAITSVISVVTTQSTLNTSRVMDIEAAKHGGLMVRLFKDFKTIKACSLNQRYISEILSLSAPMMQQSQEVMYRQLNVSFVTSLLSSIYEYGTISLAALLVVQGEINLAGFMAFQTLRGYLTAPVQEFTGMIQDLQSANASLGRLTDLYSVSDDKKVRSLSSLDGLKGKSNHTNTSDTEELISKISNESLALESQNLSFKFSSLGQPVLSEITFTCQPGTMTTVVGPSGSGKSTLMKIIAGLYSATDGKLLYDNNDWLDFEDQAIREQIGYVAQETEALRATVSDNIKLFASNISRDHVNTAVELAGLSDLIQSLPQGQNTRLLDGGFQFSGGQIQRMAIARSLVRQPSLLILDEATSALDIPTEREILKNIRSLGITIICVAHRLISAEMSDQVIVLENGKISELGSPQELKSKSDSIYAQLLRQEDNNSTSQDGPSTTNQGDLA